MPTQFATEKQIKRFWAISRSRDHAYRPWQPSEVDRLLKYHGCIDFDGKPSASRIPILKDGHNFYELICNAVAGPVPDFCLDPEEVSR